MSKRCSMEKLKQFAPEILIRVVYCPKCKTFQRCIVYRKEELKFHKVHIGIVCLNEECDYSSTYQKDDMFYGKDLFIAESRYLDMVNRDDDVIPHGYF